MRSAGEKDRARLRAQREDVTRAVVLLVGARALMFANQIVIVLINRTADGNARLHMLAHAKLIDIDIWTVVDLKRTLLDQTPKIIFGFGVNWIAVDVCALRQINLRPRNMKKA